ncbi:MAG: DUF1501 domain-containing protein [Pirellulaceae bacterium]|nr:DUF1501 domain-containing protein [Pirellulaceae bacterium]
MEKEQQTACPGPLVSGDRREFLARAGLGFGSLALASMLAGDSRRPAAAAERGSHNPLAARLPHFAPQATSVIFLFMAGGPSQMETFDPKPLLNRLHGQPVPESFGKIQTQRTTEASLLLGSQRTFRRQGKSGQLMSDLFPHLATQADEIAIVRSLHADSIVHAPALYQMNSGRTLMGHPSLGSWLLYGLGSENENLPAYVVMLDPDGTTVGGPPCWGAGYFSPVYQGTLFRPGKTPIIDLNPADGRSRLRQRQGLDLLKSLNRLRREPDDQQLLSRLATYELAFRMQTEAPEAIDLEQETAQTHQLYGADREPTAEFGRRCLMARRLVERGVRFVQLYSGGGPGNMTWDGHGDIEENHLRMAGQTDQPVAGLLKDLKQRGLLDSTLVIWAGEFGRTPMSQGKTGRDHSPFGFSLWMAGGGIQGGRSVGATDDIGLRAVERPIHVRDFHATILHQLGLDQEELTFLHDGREEKLTDTGGQVIQEIL